ncbi:suppressor APC domain-containing protein 2 isoform X3 [Carcharodon carcharias]|uniref:suppressor APC domain-containing protein 2 isoform X3 n=1 Tax=Carcharodon carcharias TaxID=13397 RepID=UPI001B7F20B6|nr:suppressor APC domain-containing protein 2 isoform X3 [Carcharodon carcharias]
MELEAGPFPQGLPRGFLHSLRTLFDILDDGRRGSVHILEIESRWQGGSGQALPPGVLQCLRRVAPASGYLTFDRFVSGLRSSLLSPGRSRSPGHRGEAAAHNKGDGRLMARYQSETTCGGIVSSWRQGRDRSELRRHTITSGVDYNRQLKCMKELELEKDALLQGLEMVDCARGWYIQQIQAIQDRQKNISKSPSGNGEVVEGNSVRLEQLLSKLQEVRCCLADLTSCSAKRLVRWSTKVNGSECHSHCSVPGVGNNLQMILMLKEQNRQLTKEVSDKSDRITQLEQEKSALIKQLFTARSHNHQESSQLDSTFI